MSEQTRVNMSIAEADRVALERLAAPKPLGAYIRQQLEQRLPEIDDPVRDLELVHEQLAALNHLGRRINAYARVVNMSRHLDFLPDAHDFIDTLGEYRDLLDELVIPPGHPRRQRLRDARAGSARITFRLPVALLELIDMRAERLQRQRSSVIRAILFEEELPPRLPAIDALLVELIHIGNNLRQVERAEIEIDIPEHCLESTIALHRLAIEAVTPRGF